MHQPIISLQVFATGQQQKALHPANPGMQLILAKINEHSAQKL